MAEANQSISQIPTIRITTAAHALAKLRSRQAVKRRSRQEGRRFHTTQRGRSLRWPSSIWLFIATS